MSSWNTKGSQFYIWIDFTEMLHPVRVGASMKSSAGNIGDETTQLKAVESEGRAGTVECIRCLPFELVEGRKLIRHDDRRTPVLRLVKMDQPRIEQVPNSRKVGTSIANGNPISIPDSVWRSIGFN